MLILSNLMSRLKLEERKGTKFEALILALILVALTISITTAWAGDTSRFNGQSAEAFFSSVFFGYVAEGFLGCSQYSYSGC